MIHDTSFCPKCVFRDMNPVVGKNIVMCELARGLYSKEPQMERHHLSVFHHILFVIHDTTVSY